MRNLKKNTYASGYFAFLIGIIVFVFILMLVSHYAFGDESIFSATGGADAYVLSPEYQNATKYERADYLDDIHGGKKQIVWIWSDGYNGYGYKWPDGYEMPAKEFTQFTEGNAGDLDMGKVLINLVTLNIDVLNGLGAVGFAIKVVIGLACVTIIYLLLPFTG